MNPTHVLATWVDTSVVAVEVLATIELCWHFVEKTTHEVLQPGLQGSVARQRGSLGWVRHATAAA